MPSTTILESNSKMTLCNCSSCIQIIAYAKDPRLHLYEHQKLSIIYCYCLDKLAMLIPDAYTKTHASCVLRKRNISVSFYPNRSRLLPNYSSCLLSACVKSTVTMHSCSSRVPVCQVFLGSGQNLVWLLLNGLRKHSIRLHHRLYRTIAKLMSVIPNLQQKIRL